MPILVRCVNCGQIYPPDQPVVIRCTRCGEAPIIMREVEALPTDPIADRDDLDALRLWWKRAKRKRRKN